MLRPGIYRDRHGALVQVVAVDEDGAVIRYSDGTVITVSAG